MKRIPSYLPLLISALCEAVAGAAESGLPRMHGFDCFFGYLNQRHAHNHFPDFLWRNEERVPLPNVITPLGSDGAGYAADGILYADDLFADQALKFVAGHQDRPFCLYWCPVIPHVSNERNRASETARMCPTMAPMPERTGPGRKRGRPR